VLLHLYLHHLLLTYIHTMSNKIQLSTILTAAAKAIGIAVVVNVALYFVLNAIGMYDADVVLDPKSGQKLSWIPIAFSTVVSMVFGTIVFIIISRFSSNPGRIFTYVCLAVFVLTIGNPFFAGFPTKFAIGLDLQHIAPAFFLWSGLSKLG
jgi:Family of unknown function (DUF6069)